MAHDLRPVVKSCYNQRAENTLGEQLLADAAIFNFKERRKLPGWN